MTTSLQDLAKTIQSLQAKISCFPQNHPGFQASKDQLKILESIIQADKLSLQLVGSDSSQLTFVADTLMARDCIASNCNLIISSLPQTRCLEEHLLLPNLGIQTSDQEIEFFSLEKNKEYQIGRANGCNILIPDQYTFVSGCHCTIKYDGSSMSWFIRDISKNGTFIHGERLELNKNQLLETGDLIVLGSMESSDQSPLLIFDNPTEGTSNLELVKEWRDFDLVCFLLEHGEVLTSSEKQTLENFALFAGKNKSSAYVLTVSEIADFENARSAKKCVDSFHKRLKTEIKNIVFNSNYFSLIFSNSCERKDDEISRPDKDFKSFLDAIEDKVKKERSEILTSRLELQVNNIEKIINMLTGGNNKRTSKKPKLPSQKIDSEKSSKLEVEIRETLKLIRDQKTDVFAKIDAYIELAEKQLFDEFYACSLPCKMQAFSRQITPSVIKIKNKKMLQLQYIFQSPSVPKTDAQGKESTNNSTQLISANEAMLYFCQNELHQWAENLWLHIQSNQTNSSLEKLHDGMVSALMQVSCLETDNIQRKRLRQNLVIDVKSTFDSAFTQVADEIFIKEPSAPSYLMKKIRSQWMQFIFLFSFFSILGIAGRRQIMRNIMAPVISLFNKAPIISSLALICLVFFGIRFGMQVYQEELEEGRNKQANELRDRLCKHYQELAKKHLVKPFVLGLKQQIEEEKSRIEKIEFFLESNLR